MVRDFNLGKSVGPPGAALDAGAVGFMGKGAPIERLVDCVRSLARGESYVLGGVGSFAHSPAPPGVRDNPLSPREREVLRLIATGFSIPEIASQLGTSRGTGKNQAASILAKLGVGGRTRAALVGAAGRLDLTDVTHAELSALRSRRGGWAGPPQTGERRRGNAQNDVPVGAPEDELFALCAAFRQAALEHRGHYRVMFEQLPDWSPGEGSRRKLFSTFERLEAAVERGVEVGRFEGPARALAAAVFAACHGHLMLELSGYVLMGDDVEAQYLDMVRRLTGRPIPHEASTKNR